jgi:8-oxo-dGTP pyrophosphatase MutT (NUDIX family)
MRVKVRALIWSGDRIVVARERRRGETVVTLPGGRVKDREDIAEALAREVLEETGLAVEVGGLRYAAEVYATPLMHDLNLIFDAKLARPTAIDEELLLDLHSAEAEDLMPPIVDRLVADPAAPSPHSVWLGNVYRSQ